MNLPIPPALLAALAAFLRGRLAEMSDAVGTVSTVVVGAAAPFATTGYSQARLVRQMHASGLLNAEDAPVARPALRGAREERSC